VKSCCVKQRSPNALFALADHTDAKKSRLGENGLWDSFWSMSTVFKARAEELIAKAIAGEGTVIDQDGKRAVLLPCDGTLPDLERDPKTDQLLRDRAQTRGAEPTAADWEALRASMRPE
jgi:hypothetical protein